MDKLCENGKKWVKRLVTYDRDQRILYYYKNDKVKWLTGLLFRISSNLFILPIFEGKTTTSDHQFAALSSHARLWR